MYRRLAAAAVLAVAIGCSAPPAKEYHQAEGALAAARAADAATYAPDELHAAETALQQYDAAVAQRDYRLALRLALDARDTAYDAAKRAGDEKAATRVRAERLLVDATAAVERLRARGTAAGGTRASAARARTALNSAQTAVQEARAELNRQQYKAAADRLSALLTRLIAESAEPAAAPVRRGR